MSQTTDITVLGQRSEARHPLEIGAGTGRGARSLYIHVPFCFHKCHYCDFYSFVDSQDRQEAYTNALIRELQRLACHAGALRTVFVGGGTPSLLRAELWERIFDCLDASFGLARSRASDEFEFTVECNPETVTRELMSLFASRGVTRVSVGAQSFVPGHLKTLERWHDPGSVARAIGLAAAEGIRRRSLDLIFGIPGQSLAEWESDLRTAIAIEPGITHISCYGLTYEPNTAMTTRLARGDFARAPEELETEMFRVTRRLLADHGFDRYEVSNFALPGEECRHNLAYWRQEDWLAAGPSASGHFAGWRWKNVPRLTDWKSGIEARSGFSPVIDVEAPDARRALAERLMTGLRLGEGLVSSEMLQRAEELGRSAALARVARRQAERGLIDASGGRWRLTEEGFLLADGIASEFMGVVTD